MEEEKLLLDAYSAMIPFFCLREVTAEVVIVFFYEGGGGVGGGVGFRGSAMETALGTIPRTVAVDHGYTLHKVRMHISRSPFFFSQQKVLRNGC